MSSSQSPNFDSIRQVDPYDNEYWSARDLQPLLGYSKWQKFEDAIERAKTSCKESGNIVPNHFTPSGKMVHLGSGAQRETKDYVLTRFACYLIAMNGDSRKLEIAAAQTYFAASTRAHEIEQLRLNQEQRIEKRLKVTESFKALASAATDAGVESGHMGIFMDSGNLGLYDYTREELNDVKGIPENEEYLDRIGTRELSAVDFKNTLATGTLQDNHVQKEDQAIDTHYKAGRAVRRAIEEMKQPLPETLPTEPSIRKLVEERQRAMKKRKMKAAEQSQMQDTLFGGQDQTQDT